MKKLLALILTLTMTCSLALPALAAGTTDERLSAVTLKVKETLSLDTEEFTEFYGDLDENILAPTWRLNWSGETSNLSISATEEGKVLGYYRSDESESYHDYNSTFAPTFPAGDQESAKASALAFVEKVLIKGETIALDNSRGTPRLGATQYRFYGEILLNGLSANLSFSISVRAQDGMVTSFSRDDLNGRYIGGIPSATPSATQAGASELLRSTLSLRLEYALGEEGNTAVLRYLPDAGDTFYVDAQTGELINLSELFSKLNSNDLYGEKARGSSDAAAAEGAPSSLSETELEGIAKLEGVLDKTALDGKLQAIPALGLSSYSLASVSYFADRVADESGESAVTATLTYGKRVDGSSWRRTAAVDAKTGELLWLRSSGWLGEDAPARTVTATKAQRAAEQFLTQFASDQFGKTDLYDSFDVLENSYGVSHSFLYAQKANGYFYTGNTLSIQVDSTDGSISYYEKNFDDSVAFDNPEGIISAEAAIDAWLATYETTLRYVQVPVAIDFSLPEYAPLADIGLSYLYKLVLGHTLERDGYPVGIDAKTGQVVTRSAPQPEGITYDDIANHWAKTQLEALAQYEVGYTGGSFLPGKALTQLDLVALLMSAEGYLYYPDEDGAADWLYERAHSTGVLSREDRNDSAVLTRAQTVALILDASGYGPIAQLEGIFRTSFADDSAIPAAYYGYAALAQGLGVVGGTPGSRFLPGANATRSEAAVMLYNLMSR